MSDYAPLFEFMWNIFVVYIVWTLAKGVRR